MRFDPQSNFVPDSPGQKPEKRRGSAAGRPGEPDDSSGGVLGAAVGGVVAAAVVAAAVIAYLRLIPGPQIAGAAGEAGQRPIIVGSHAEPEAPWRGTAGERSASSPGDAPSPVVGEEAGEQSESDHAAASSDAAAEEARKSLSEAQLNAAMIFLAAGRHRDAIPHLESAVELDPQNIDAHYRLGLCLIRLGDMEGARAAQAALRRLDPNLANLLGNLIRNASPSKGRSARSF